MFIITHQSLMEDVKAMHKDYCFEPFSITKEETLRLMETHSAWNGGCYCWYPQGEHFNNIPQEVEDVYAHNDLCAEEYEFEDLSTLSVLITWQVTDGKVEYTRQSIQLIED